MVVNNLVFFGACVGWICVSIPGILFSMINLGRVEKTRHLVGLYKIDGARGLMASHQAWLERVRLVIQIILGCVGYIVVTAGVFPNSIDIRWLLAVLGVDVVVFLTTMSSLYSYLVGLALDRFIDITVESYKISAAELESKTKASEGET